MVKLKTSCATCRVFFCLSRVSNFAILTPISELINRFRMKIVMTIFLSSILNRLNDFEKSSNLEEAHARVTQSFVLGFAV